MKLIILLSILACVSVYMCREPDNLRELKDKYTLFLTKIRAENTDPRFDVLKKRILVSGFRGGRPEVGYNINKGDEIGVCVHGTPNQMFHVLIHELAHTTVPEYDHSEQFWKNFNDLKQKCIGWGIYQGIPSETKFCGKYIRD